MPIWTLYKRLLNDISPVTKVITMNAAHIICGSERQNLVYSLLLKEASGVVDCGIGISRPHNKETEVTKVADYLY